MKKVLLVIAVLLVVGVIVVATRPATFRYERSATIAAPPSVVFPLVNDFHRWGEWSPWEKLDPAMKKTYEGPAAGPGAAYGWVGNKDVGEGKMTILDSAPNQSIKIKLEFLKPFAATNDTEFTFAPEGQGTKVTWAMAGSNGFMSKAFGMFVDMDKMIGKDFESGLANLNTAAQADAAKAQAAEKAPQEQAAAMAADAGTDGADAGMAADAGN